MLKIYVCGPTVYNDVHIGNLRPIITMDLILKAARYLNIDFKFIHNITDIDDKIINRALEQNKTESEIANYYADEYLNLLNKFNVNTVNQFEYVTKNLDVINNFIKQLVANNNAYLDSENNVYFDVQKNINNYGIVSNQKIDNMIFEENNNLNKKFQADFALWKNTNVGIKYDSSFGPGRPGWHTECAALIYKHFGDQGVDIHGGGMDLTFPHHENENIQFYALTNNNLTKKWIRNGQIDLNGIKMSKSLQNVFLAKDFLEQYPADYLKMIFLLNNLTSIINIDDNLFNNVKKIYRRIKMIYFNFYLENKNYQPNFDQVKTILNYVYEIKFANFNKEINQLIKNININNDAIDQSTLIEIFNALGFDFNKINYAKYIAIYKEWKELLANKNYQEADILRDKLTKKELI
ncbi:class I tRNA ligase family protein [Mycoplasma sp. NEAQ87857]|uniref:class I tRNA ligase family protein n=1 Tax=Mycoplasma sp. NEAQ87857 TaxID=2683967 RepID=UPI001315ECBC|nr:class I tRNA ligase family protein [Mycoplasma sp. NEAQ87857]QGZ97929.1 class I tRNA ligase family protein [Mycoplasma sp. NEAQ87857]